jgi:hypothetical protein
MKLQLFAKLLLERKVPEIENHCPSLEVLPSMFSSIDLSD